MNYKSFFDKVRTKFGPLNQGQVDGFENIIEEAIRRGCENNDLAYILATVWHETAFTMQPIKEYGGEKYLKSKKYYPHYGRGLVQLTWLYNYEKASKKLGIDFVKHPDKLLDWEYALPILFVGMEEGWFTGKSLSDYIDDVDEDNKEDLREFANARRIINGTDKQVEIGQIALFFELALKESQYGVEPAAEPVEAIEEDTEYPVTKQSVFKLLTILISILKKLLK